MVLYVILFTSVFVHFCVCTLVCIHFCVCTLWFAHTSVYIYFCMYTRVNTLLYVNRYAYVCIHLLVCTHTCVHLCVHTLVCIDTGHSACKYFILNVQFTRCINSDYVALRIYLRYICTRPCIGKDASLAVPAQLL